MSGGEPSKNSKCPCGSGKKYRKCCKGKRPPQATINKIVRHFAEQDRRRREFTENYGHVRAPMASKFGDSVVTIIGGGIYRQTRPGPYTFMTALHDHALLFFGDDYLENEESKPFADRHPAIQWMHALVEHDQHAVTTGAESASQTGNGAAWFRFAYDLWTIRDSGRLEKKLKERLLAPDKFQGARHELAVAALCVAAGFDLQWEDESDNSATHAEFVGTDRFSALKIAVEAKSRHRRGVKGFASGKNVTPGTTVDIRGITNDALKKTTHLPLYVFIDVNLPAADESTRTKWLQEIDQTMMALAQEGYASPSAANIVFFMNDPSHYLASSPIAGDANTLWITRYHADIPRVAHPDADMLERLMKVWRQRGAPPGDFVDFNNTGQLSG